MKLPMQIPISEVELLIFLLDGSGSMADQNTPDGRMKAEHLYEIVKEVLGRLQRSTKRDVFRICFIYFSDRIVIESSEDGAIYFTINEALKHFRNPLEVVEGGATHIADALTKVQEVVDHFFQDDSFPEDKVVTIFLFTDGQETSKSYSEVLEQARNLLTHPISPIIATISFGKDADEQLLMDIASPPSSRQRRHLDLMGILSHLPNRDKLYIRGNTEEGTLTKEKAEIIRNFVETLSATRT